MSDIPTTGIGELAPTRPLARALAEWNGFAELAPALLGGVDLPYLLPRDSPDENWKWDRMPRYPLNPVGCSFLRDLEISGSGYLFHEGRFVREFVNLSDTALRWLGQPDVDDNPLVRPRTNRVVIEEPVLMVFGPGSGTYGHWLLDFFAPDIHCTSASGFGTGRFRVAAAIRLARVGGSNGPHFLRDRSQPHSPFF
jgi:hypothetical protein